MTQQEKSQNYLKECAEVVKDIIIKYQENPKNLNQIELGILTALSYGASISDLWGDFYRLKELKTN